jgi:hypothetical protein
MRIITCLSGKNKAVDDVRFRKEDYILERKYDGCAEKVTETRTIEF